MPGTEITFGNVSLLQQTTQSTTYKIDACTDGTDYGNPEATVAEVASMLMDGDAAQVTRYGNRTATIKVRVKGATLDIVATGTAAIEAEVNKGRNTLTWLPPGTATASVFDVVYSTLDFGYDDLTENHVTRYFTLTLACLPFARRALSTTVVATALPATTPTITSIDACTSTTGWASPTGTIALADGGTSVRETGTAPGSNLAEMTRSGLSSTIAVGEYVMVTVEDSTGGYWYLYNDLQILLNGTAATYKALVADGTKRTYYLPRPSSGTLNTVKVAGTTFPTPDWISVHDISKSTGLPFTGSNAQRLFSVPIGGTARTQADIVVETPTGTIGQEGIVYTYRSGAALYPPLRGAYLTSSGGAGGTANVNSNAVSFTAASVFTIPAASIPPGTYSLVVRTQNTAATAYSLSWLATTTGSLTSTALDQSGSVSVPAGSGAYRHVEAGTLSLPTVAVGAGSAANVVLTVSSSLTGVNWDEMWLFNLDAGDLTRLQTPSGASRMIVSSATLGGNSRPSWKIGTQATVANDIDAGDRATAPGVHQITPGPLTAFVVTPLSGAGGQTVTLSLYERFRHHVTP